MRLPVPCQESSPQGKISANGSKAGYESHCRQILRPGSIPREGILLCEPEVPLCLTCSVAECIRMLYSPPHCATPHRTATTMRRNTAYTRPMNFAPRDSTALPMALRRAVPVDETPSPTRRPGVSRARHSAPLLLAAHPLPRRFTRRLPRYTPPRSSSPPDCLMRHIARATLRPAPPRCPSPTSLFHEAPPARHSAPLRSAPLLLAYHLVLAAS